MPHSVLSFGLSPCLFVQSPTTNNTATCSSSHTKPQRASASPRSNMSPAKKSLFNLVLVLSAMLVISVAESRDLGVTFGQPTPDCKKVFGVRPGDTCFEITRLFNLSTTFFELLNPNLICNQMFVGEWVCVDGTLS